MFNLYEEAAGEAEDQHQGRGEQDKAEAPSETKFRCPFQLQQWLLDVGSYDFMTIQSELRDGSYRCHFQLEPLSWYVSEFSEAKREALDTLRSWFMQDRVQKMPHHLLLTEGLLSLVQLLLLGAEVFGVRWAVAVASESVIQWIATRRTPLMS